MPEDAERVCTDALMDEIRRRIRGDLPAARAAELAAVEALHRAVHERAELLRDRLREDTDYRLRTFVRFESHRGRLAPWIDLVKRRILFPINFWLFQFCRDNFERQGDLNVEMLASIEVLAIENAALKRKLEQLQVGAPGGDDADSYGR